MKRSQAEPAPTTGRMMMKTSIAFGSGYARFGINGGLSEAIHGPQWMALPPGLGQLLWKPSRPCRNRTYRTLEAKDGAGFHWRWSETGGAKKGGWGAARRNGPPHEMRPGRGLRFSGT